MVLWTAVNYRGSFLITLAILLLVAYTASGFFIGKQLLHNLKVPEFEVDSVPWLRHRSFTVRALLVFLTAPVIIMFAGLLLVFSALIAIMFGLHEDHDLFVRAWRWFSSARLSERRWLSWLHPWTALTCAGIFALIAFSFISEGVRSLAILIAVVVVGVATFMGFIVCLAWMVDTLRTQRSKRRAVVSSGPARKAKPPSRIAVKGKSFFRSIGDLLVLVWSLILTRKLKICPWMDLPENT